MQRSNRFLTVFMFAATAMAACDSQRAPDTAESTGSDAPDVVHIHPENWPLQAPVMVRDPEMEAAISELMARMTLEEKVGQVIQADISAVTPDDVREYNLGSILNGGGSAPGGDNRTTPDKWLELADEFWDASTDMSDGGVGIPTVWGTDAVHGNSNVLGATLFPHNIGLGMANDPDLMFEIGRVTAKEILVTGLDWTFAPTIAVARNDRWGRTYESYSEDPRIVAAYAPRIIEGIQGVLGTDDFLSDDHMFATAKHFAGDGGTTDGIDQGDTAVSEEAFRSIQAAGYPVAIKAGVQSVMASFNSYHGRKMHGYKEMLTGVLVGRMGFDGFVVGDWNGHGQVAGCSNTSCAASFNAGLDMFMAPESWKGIYQSTLAQVKSGEISMQRLDEAVSRILRVKMRAGVFDAGRPSTRKHAGKYSLLGAPEHRAIARDAVRKSLVLLKNAQGLLPLSPTMNILVAGDGADNIGKQSGGWTLNWQGNDNLNEHFPNGTSIFAGIFEAVQAGGGSATLSVDGSYSTRPDVAIVVFGEDPYAEGIGDRPNVDYDSDDGLALLKKFKAADIPTVSVFISGRPMWVNPEINASDAFVAAWLPGSEGGGIADVLIGDGSGSARFDFAGRLSFSWPKTADQVNVNVGDADYHPLFAYGYGLGYADDGKLETLSENSGLNGIDGSSIVSLLEFGDAAGDWHLILRDDGGDAALTDSRGVSTSGTLRARAADHMVQEDSVMLDWSGPASVVLQGPSQDFAEASAKGMVLELSYQVLLANSDAITIAVGDGAVDLTKTISEGVGENWQRVSIALSCFEARGANAADIAEPLLISSTGPLTLQVQSARIVPNAGDASCSSLE
jgi:beta-glucosidase